MPDNLGGWLWWLFDKLVWLVVGVLLAELFLKPKAISIWGEYSEKQKIRNERERKWIEDAAKRILSYPTEREYFYFTNLRVSAHFYGELTAAVVTLASSSLALVSLMNNTALLNSKSISEAYAILSQSPASTLALVASLIMAIFSTTMIPLIYGHQKQMNLMKKVNRLVRREIDKEMQDQAENEEKENLSTQPF